MRADFVQGPASCSDSTSLGAGEIALAFSARSLRARYAGPDLHKRCPGPLVVLKLTASVPLLDDGYLGTTVPDLTVTLTRGRIRTGVQSD